MGSITPPVFTAMPSIKTRQQATVLEIPKSPSSGGIARLKPSASQWKALIQPRFGLQKQEEPHQIHELGSREDKMWRFSKDGELVPSISDWRDVTPTDVEEYLFRNLGTTDVDGPPMKALIKSLKSDGLLEYAQKAFWKELANGQQLLMSDVGSGAAFHTSFFLTGLAKALKINNYEMDLIEPTRASREVMRRSLYGKELEDMPLQEALWNPFRDLMKDQGGADWNNRFDDIRDHARIVNGDIFELPKNRYHVAMTVYTPCSIADTIEEFDQAIKAFVGSIKPGGLVLSILTEGSRGWPAGVSWLPAAPITKEVVEESFRKAGAYVNVTLIDQSPRAWDDETDTRNEFDEKILVVSGIKKLD
jgi:hypothetical protein